MLVKHRMTTQPHTIPPETPVAEALSYMRQNRIRRLPIVDKKGKLVGIVSEKDLLYASPSPATSLSVYEVGYLLAKLKVEDVMARKVMTVEADAPLEEAARIMADNKIGGLPVMTKGEMVGIITETDIFKTFLEMMGGREAGLRVTLEVQDKPGTLSRITGEIASCGGDIVTLGTFYGDDKSCNAAMITLKVRGIEKAVLVEALEKLDAKVTDIRESASTA